MKVFLSIFLILSLLIHSKGQTITATGGMWSNSIAANTITVAGNDYNQNVTSGVNQTFLDVFPSTTFLTRNWVVRINKVDSQWHNSLELYAKRTGDGQGGVSIIIGLNTILSSISGGSVYNPVTNISTEFFRGVLSHISIPIQYEIRGLSVLIPAGNYTTTVYYTISDN